MGEDEIKKKRSLLCCFCFDRKSAIFVISTLTIFHSVINVALAIKVLTEQTPTHVYVIAIAVKTYDAPSGIKQIYTLLAQVKITVFITHFLSSVTLASTLFYSSKKRLHIIAPVFAATELLTLIYTVAESLFTTIQLNELMSRALVSIAMLVSCAFMFWCALIVVTYSKSYEEEEGSSTTNFWLHRKGKRLIAYYKQIDDMDKLPITDV